MSNENQEDTIYWPKNPENTNAILGLLVGGQGLQAESLSFLLSLTFQGESPNPFEVIGFSAFRMKKCDGSERKRELIEHLPYFLDNIPELALKAAGQTKLNGLNRNYEARRRGAKSQGVLDLARDTMVEFRTEGRSEDEITKEFIDFFGNERIESVEYIHFTGLIPLINGVPFVVEGGELKPFSDEELKKRIDTHKSRLNESLRELLRNYLYNEKYSLEEVRLKFLKDFFSHFKDCFGFELPAISVDCGELIPSSTPGMEYIETKEDSLKKQTPKIKKVRITDDSQEVEIKTYEAGENDKIELVSNINHFYDIVLNGEVLEAKIPEKCIIVERGGPIQEVKVKKMGAILNPNYIAFENGSIRLTEEPMIDLMKGAQTKAEKRSYNDWIICNAKRLALHREIEEIKKIFEEAFPREPFHEILKRIPDSDKKYKKSLNIKGLNISRAEEGQDVVSLNVYFERYLRCKYALKILSVRNKEPHFKMREAAKILNEPLEYGRDFLERFNDSVKIHIEELESEKKAKATVCAKMQDEAEEIRFILLEEILETLEEMCSYNSKKEEWQIHVSVQKYQIFIDKLIVYAEIASKFAKSDGPADRGDQISSDINEKMLYIPKFLEIKRNSKLPLEILIATLQKEFNRLLEIERTWKIKSELLLKAEEFNGQLYQTVAGYIEQLGEDLAPDILDKFDELQRANQELTSFLGICHEKHDRVKKLLNGQNGRVIGKSLDLLGSQACSEILLDDFQALEEKYNEALNQFKELWINQEGLQSIVKNRKLAIKDTFLDAVNSALFYFEPRHIYGPGFTSDGLGLFFKAIIKSVRETESKNTLNEIKKTCQAYLKALSGIKKENRFFSEEKERNGGLVSGWINMLDYPGYRRIEFCSPGNREVPKKLEKGVLYLEKMDHLDDEDDASRIKLHTLYHWDNGREVGTKKLIHVFNEQHPNDIAWELGEITRAEDEGFFQSIAGLCRCSYSPDEKLKKIKEAVKENFEIKTTLWAEFLEKLLELLKNIGFDIPEKASEEKFKKKMELTLTEWKKEQDRKEEGIHNMINPR